MNYSYTDFTLPEYFLFFSTSTFWRYFSTASFMFWSHNFRSWMLKVWNLAPKFGAASLWFLIKNIHNLPEYFLFFSTSTFWRYFSTASFMFWSHNFRSWMLKVSNIIILLPWSWLSSNISIPNSFEGLDSLKLETLFLLSCPEKKKKKNMLKVT